MKCKSLGLNLSYLFLPRLYSNAFFCFSDLAKSLDFGRAHTLISAVINQIGELIDGEEVSTLFGQISEFCVQNEIDLNIKTKQRRRRMISTRLENVLVASTISEREEIDNEIKYRTCVYYPVIDSIIAEMNNRFSQKNIEILHDVSSLSPHSPGFLEAKELKSLCVMLHYDIGLVFNEI